MRFHAGIDANEHRLYNAAALCCRVEIIRLAVCVDDDRPDAAIERVIHFGGQFIVSVHINFIGRKSRLHRRI